MTIPGSMLCWGGRILLIHVMHACAERSVALLALIAAARGVGCLMTYIKPI